MAAVAANGSSTGASSSGAAASAHGGGVENVVNYIPQQMEELMRLVCRIFYEPEVGVIMDMLLKEKCVKESDIVELMQLDPKTVAQVLVRLEKDKLAQRKLCLDPNAPPDPAAQPQVFWYIHFKHFVDMVKYRLHVMGENISRAGLNSSSHTTFECKGCRTRYADIDVPSLMDPMEGKLRCRLESCGELVERDHATMSAAADAARGQLAIFNKQTNPLYALLQEIDKVVLAHALLDPAPTKRALREEVEKAKSRGARPARQHTGPITNAMYTTAPDVGQSVNLVVLDRSHAATETYREMPVWLRADHGLSADVANALTPSSSSAAAALAGGASSFGASAATSYANAFGEAKPVMDRKPTPADFMPRAANTREIIELLELTEAESASTAQAVGTAAARAEGEQAGGEGSAEGAEGGLEEEEDLENTVFVINGQSVRIQQITKEHKALFTPEQRAQYDSIMEALSMQM